jgi:hypothetical protein
MPCVSLLLTRTEAHSFLPDEQSDRGDLACQREAGHRRFHPFGEQCGIEIVKGTRRAASLGRRALEDAFQIMIVVLVETTQRHGPLGSLQLTLHIVVFPTAVRFQSQAAVCPELSLGAKPVRRLQQRDQQSSPNRTDIRNPLEQVRRGMSIDEIAAEEGVRRQAVYASINTMLRKNEYCRISGERGVLRPKVNQYQ